MKRPQFLKGISLSGFLLVYAVALGTGGYYYHACDIDIVSLPSAGDASELQTSNGTNDTDQQI